MITAKSKRYSKDEEEKTNRQQTQYMTNPTSLKWFLETMAFISSSMSAVKCKTKLYLGNTSKENEKI